MAMFVAEHLNLDVAGIDDEFLDEHPMSPNDVLASAFASPNPSATSEVECAIRMPLPPPPAEALIITG